MFWVFYSPSDKCLYCTKKVLVIPPVVDIRQGCRFFCYKNSATVLRIQLIYKVMRHNYSIYLKKYGGIRTLNSSRLIRLQRSKCHDNTCIEIPNTDNTVGAVCIERHFF